MQEVWGVLQALGNITFALLLLQRAHQDPGHHQGAAAVGGDREETKHNLPLVSGNELQRASNKALQLVAEVSDLGTSHKGSH